MKKSSLGFGKLFNVLQSLIGRMASRPMRNIETFLSNQMYLCLSLVERKVAEFFLNELFYCFLRTIDGVLSRQTLSSLVEIAIRVPATTMLEQVHIGPSSILSTAFL